MERRLGTACALLLGLVLGGCAGPIRTTPVPAGNQVRIYRDGLPAVISRKQFVVMVSPSTLVREGNERMRFVVSVANTSTEPLDLDTTNFSATVDARPIKIMSHEEVVAEIRKRQAIAAFAVALGGAMQAAAAQQQASTSYNYGTYNRSTTGTFNAYGQQSRVYGNYTANTVGTYSGWTYNPAAGQAAAAAVNAQTSSNLDRLQADGAAALSEAARNMLKMTTVFPSSSHGGQLVLAEFEVPESGNTLELVAEVRGERHVFVFTQQRVR